MKDFYDLEVWKQGRDFKMYAAKLSKQFPPEEKFVLTDQLKRSSRSINANISEGHGRFHYQENIQYCRQAWGSLTESLNHFIDAFDDKYISKEQLNEGLKKYKICLKLINGYMAYLKKRKAEE